MGGSGTGGAQGLTGNPPPNAYPDRAPSVAANASANFGPYMSALQRKIKMAWKPPRGTESNRIMVTFSVLQNGRLENLQMIVASADAGANQAALEAVAKASPFDPLPAGAGPKVDVEFTFDYNVFQKTRF
jgi:TonB family protein